MTVIYFADGARAVQPQNPYQDLDLRLWLQDTQPGDSAVGRRNPRLWPPPQLDVSGRSR
jgi:hypothetical protein